jgi:CDP-diacylglycerol--glycerol-3-phosphate 3-phosphatidyltransferase
MAASAGVKGPLAQLPNAITIGRIILIPIFVVVLATADGGSSWLAGLLFAAAGISDQIDGWLARRWHVESTFGKFADPLADRLMIDAAVIMLVVGGRLPWLALLVIGARDLFLIFGTRYALPRGYEFSVSFLGKLATWVLYAGIAFVIVTHDGTRWPLWIFWAGIGLAVAAAVAYGASAYRQLRGGGRGGADPVEVTRA